MGRGYDSSTQGQLRTPVPTTDRERTFRAQQRRATTRQVATRAVDAQDCAFLLDVLGLHPSEGFAP